eukprot:Skav233925  [mRNA]  locus=scaffold3520:3222:3956:+ [translate_table: standard]
MASTLSSQILCVAEGIFFSIANASCAMLMALSSCAIRKRARPTVSIKEACAAVSPSSLHTVIPRFAAVRASSTRFAFTYSSTSMRTASTCAGLLFCSRKCLRASAATSRAFRMSCRAR